MGIKNEMEQLVRDEVARARREGGPGYAGCWCPLCEIDIVALALTLLPPLYCRTATSGNAAGLIRAGTITDAVQSALKRVEPLAQAPPGHPADDAGRRSRSSTTRSRSAPSMVGPALGLSAHGLQLRRVPLRHPGLRAQPLPGQVRGCPRRATQPAPDLSRLHALRTGDADRIRPPASSATTLTTAAAEKVRPRFI